MKLNKRLLVFLISFVFFILWAHALPITDTVESNYALTAKEMVAAGDWLSPRIYGKFWYDKPAMIYWLLALAMKLLGYSDLALRVVPALAGAIGVTLIYWFVTKLSNERLGTLAAVLLGTSLQYFMIAKLIITDMVLFDFNAAALIFFYLGFIARDGTKAKRWYLPMYACFALAVLTKGPVGIMLPGLIILLFLAWQRQWAELKNMRIGEGLLLFCLIALPWYGFMYLKHGNLFIQNFFGVHNLLRATVSEHPKANVFYYYLVVFVLSTLPWTGVMTGGIWDAIKKIRQKDMLAQFLIVWIGVFFIFYTLIATKYLTYTFPFLFPVAVLGAIYLGKHLEANSGAVKSWVLLWPLLLLNVLFVFIAYRILKNGLLLDVYLSLAILSFIFMIWCLFRAKEPQRLRMQQYGVIVSYLLLAVMVLPAYAQLQSGKNFARDLSSYKDYRIGTYQSYSTSAVYYSGHLLDRIEPEDAVGKFRNPSFTWYAKYTMPVYTIEEFKTQPGQKKMIIVPTHSEQKFLKEASGTTLEKLAQKDNDVFYRIIP